MNLIDRYISAYLKAHLGGLGAALTLALADLDSKAGLHSATQWYYILGAYLGTGALVAVVPNSGAVPAAQAPAQDIVS